MHHEGHDEKGMSPGCDNCQDCGYCCGGGHHGRKKAKLYFFVGVLAIVYGIVNYLINVLVLPDYQAWILGGVLLLLIGALKKHMMKH